MIEIGNHAEGLLINVRAQPRARRARIVGEHAGALKVAVTEPPERGKANQAIIEVLCAQFGLRTSQVTLMSGEASRDKRFLLADLEPGELRQRLNRIMAGANP